MNARAKYSLTTLLVLLFSVPVAHAQENALAQGGPAFAQQELDQMLAPIALYPDALLSQILMASTYPVEIAEAARWSRLNPGLSGEQAVRAVEWNDWDPSVKSLVAFPQILTLMDEKLDWTQRLGDTFLDQQAQVMDTIQNLRRKAYTAGNLRSTDQLRVDVQGSTFVVGLANPELIYVPYYNPTVIYGTWWWPTHQPVYWAPWPGYHARTGFIRGFAWGPGIRVSSGFFFGAADWHRRCVTIVNVNHYYYNMVHVNRQTDITRNINAANGALKVWQHDTAHRRDVPYREAALRQPSGHTSAAPEARRDFRGHDPSSAVEGRGGPGTRPDARGNPASRPAESGSAQHVVAGLGTRSNTERAPVKPTVPVVASPDKRSAPVTVARPSVEQRPAARDGAGRKATAPVVSVVPAPLPSGNVTAPKPSVSAPAPQPAGNPRGSSGKRNHSEPD